MILEDRHDGALKATRDDREAKCIVEDIGHLRLAADMLSSLLVELRCDLARCDGFSGLVARGKAHEELVTSASTRRTVRTKAARDLVEYTSVSLKISAGIVSKVKSGNGRHLSLGKLVEEEKTVGKIQSDSLVQAGPPSRGVANRLGSFIIKTASSKKNSQIQEQLVILRSLG